MIVTHKLLKFPSDLKPITDEVCGVVDRYSQFDFKLMADGGKNTDPGM